MKFFIEIKNRLLLVLFTWFYLVLINYYYKEILYFFLIHYTIINKNSNFYFVYTNITELFTVYVKLIQFLTFQIISFYLIFNILSFLKPATYKKEFKILEQFIYIYIISWLINFWLVIAIIFPNMWTFFLSYNNFIFLNLLHLEVTINSYFEFFIYVYNFIFTYFYIVISITVVLFKTVRVAKNLIKYRKFIYYLMLIFFFSVDLIIQFLTFILCILFLEFLFIFILVKIVYYQKIR